MPPSQVPVEETASPEKRSAGLSGTIIRYALSIVLIAVALFGLLVPLPVGNLTISPNVQTFYDQIDRLPANSKVLVAFDWEADRSGEMGPLSTSVVQHIMAKRARLVTIKPQSAGSGPGRPDHRRTGDELDLRQRRFLQIWDNLPEPGLAFRPGSRFTQPLQFDWRPDRL